MPKKKNEGTFFEPFSWNVDEYINLYHAMSIVNIGEEEALRLGLEMVVQAYLQDPYVAADVTQNKKIPAAAVRSQWTPLNFIFMPCEPDMKDGPTSARFAVVDYDADTGRLEPAAVWDKKRQRFMARKGTDLIELTPDLPQFHQVNVWAIAQTVLDMYEHSYILGRATPWAFEGNRLLLVPHAGELQNAFYDRSTKSIQFYYFNAGGHRINTCLSHDIIAHETGHAILDGLRPYYLENSSVQNAAFHEFIADTTAILSAFLNNKIRFEVIRETHGDLRKDTIVSALAEEFGYYSCDRPYLRSAQNKLNMEKVNKSISPYDWSQVLTGAMFDILKEMLAINRKTPRSNGRYPSLAQSFSDVCNRFRRVAFQPLDYLPPVDVQFSDYANAVLRADYLIDPEDRCKYRQAMKKVFENRGIVYTEQGQPLRLHFYNYDIDHISRSRSDAYRFLNENRRQLCIPAEQDIAVLDLYQTSKWALEQPQSKLPREIVIQYMWREDVKLEGNQYGPLNGEHASLLCGGTLVFDSRGNVLSWQHKPGTGEQESSKVRLRDYCEKEHEDGMKRKSDLKSYLKNCVATGQVGIEEQTRPDQLAPSKSPFVFKRASDGSLRCQTAPHLRHWKQK